MAEGDSEERFRLFAEAGFEGICVTDRGIFIDANAQMGQLLGRSVSELIGRPVLDFVAPDFQEKVARQIAAGPDRQFEHFEHMVVHADGTLIPVEIRGRAATLAGHPVRVTVVRDVSAHRRLLDQVQAASRMESIGRLAGGVAHDFNNLLTIIQGSASLLRGGSRGEPQDEESLTQIEGAAARAAELTRQLLAFARRQRVQPSVLDLNAVVNAMDGMLRRLIGERVEVVTRLGSGLGSVRADRAHVEQVLMNLVVNARDAMEAGGRLTIETANVVLDRAYVAAHPEVTPGEHVMLAVGDTGVGMDDATVERVFEPFFTTKAVGRGTGLGLATCYGIIMQAGGSIDVSSEVAQGTTFRVYLPRVFEIATAPEPRVPAPAAGGRETILVAEDDAAVRRLAVRVLGNQGYTVHEARDGVQALEVFRGLGGRIDLVVTDVVMPRLDGPGLAAELRKAAPDLRVLFASGYAAEALPAEDGGGRAVDLIAKPYLPDELARRVRDALDRPAK